MYIRCCGCGVLWQCDSKDDGLSWGEPQLSEIPNCGTKFDLIKIDNQILLLNNDSAKERNPLSLWVSSDNCQSWRRKIELVRSAQRNQWICYPHAFVDIPSQQLYVASDAVKEFYLQKIPLADVL